MCRKGFTNSGDFLYYVYMRFSVIIPSYNESSSIADVVRELYSALKETENSFEIVVVDNGSTDETPEILSDLKKEITQLCTTRVFPNQGYGNGILAGLRIAKGEVLGWVHADNQANPEDVVRIYKKLLDENLDFCKVNRINRTEHHFRILQSKIYNNFFKMLFRTNLSDINGSPKLFRRALYEKAQLSSKDWFIDPEIVIKAKRLGCAMGEIPIKWQSRAGGFSKVKIGTGLEFFKNMLSYRFLNRK